MEQEKRFYIPSNNANELTSIANAKMIEESEELKKAIDDIKNSIIAELNDDVKSIVLRGSLAYGGFIKKISDLDLVVFLNKHTADGESILEKIAGVASSKYSHLFQMVDISGVDFEDVCQNEKNTRLYLNLKLTGKTLYGADFISKLPPCICNPELLKKLYRQTVGDSAETLKMIDTAENIFYMGKQKGCDFLCVWFMRNIIRGFAVPIFLKKNIFSMHLTTCCYELSLLFPQYKELIEKIWHSERYPIHNWNELSLFCRKALELFEEVCNASWNGELQ
ncbi:MAG: nucleotidyltransferase domain-containing protein [Clostridia bacterium]|nr:nucleotidyltransferase domain-containing protein [Clostridia bacterium]